MPKSRGLGFETGFGMLLREGPGSENDMGRSIKVLLIMNEHSKLHGLNVILEKSNLNP